MVSRFALLGISVVLSASPVVMNFSGDRVFPLSLLGYGMGVLVSILFGRLWFFMIGSLFVGLLPLAWFFSGSWYLIVGWVFWVIFIALLVLRGYSRLWIGLVFGLISFVLESLFLLRLLPLTTFVWSFIRVGLMAVLVVLVISLGASQDAT